MRLNPTWHGIDLHWAYVDLLPTIYRQTRHRCTACDILHDALIRFAISSNPNRLLQPQAYLHTIVRNLLIDGHKEQSRFLPLLDEDMESGIAYELDQPLVPSTEHLMDIQQRLAILQNIIDHLPPRCKETFWLFRIENLSQQEIADKLGISLNMVQKHIMRAMLDLLEAKDLIN
ncbi:sigma-70 family RNA polymerase sigma factor [Methylobacillus arboreus]|uniref:RNA polymerase sigma factor n=1 Tax=Methylobacillus arboreus TaxID=755170 RepID=UPI001E620D00|nr:sigma-70 family RNA polymerase sigma factor [Methylobacillus arboreus]MCB5189347.1 sigma-70 family RNA polymerase sigma factor [Methylobacillus arboreus]